MNRKTTLVLLVIGLVLLLNVPAAMAQQQFVYPQKGQSADQQKKDEYDCHTWAVQQTKYDPTAAAQAPAQPPHSSRQAHSRAPEPAGPREAPSQARR